MNGGKFMHPHTHIHKHMCKCTCVNTYNPRTHMWTKAHTEFKFKYNVTFETTGMSFYLRMLILAISLKKYRWDMLDLSKKHLHIKAKLNRRKSITTLIFRINDLFSLGYLTLKVQVRHGWLIKVASLHKGKIK